MFQLDQNRVVAMTVFLVLLWLCNAVLAALRPGLRHIPGPILARFTSLWRVRFVWHGKAHEEYRALHARYGPLVRTAPNVLDISDPAVIPIIYSINSKFLKSSFYNVFNTMYEGTLMPSMFSTRDPEEHKHLKRSVSQKYSMTSIRSLEYLVDPCSKIFTDAMMDQQGSTVDLGSWVQWYAFDVIGAMSFSKRFGFMENRKDMNGAIAGIEKALMMGGIVGQLPWLTGVFGDPRMRSAMDKVEKLRGDVGDPIAICTKMVQDSIDEYDVEAAKQDNRGDFLAYVQQQHEKSKTAMTHRDMVNHLLNNLLAGSDTTGLSLRAIFYYVMRNKQVYQKLQNEIDTAQAAGNLSQFITYAESLELGYLQACMKEAMRMHPGVSFPLERIVPAGGAKLCDVHIPPGTIVGVNAAVIHRNTDIFGADANEFRPERWLDNDEETLKNMDRHLLTFGAGARTCIGKNISIMEMGKLVPQVLRQFQLEWAASEPSWKVHTYWFARQTGLLVRMIPRKEYSTSL